MSQDSRDGYYSKKVMQAVKGKNDIVDVIGEYTKLTGPDQEGRFHGNNPFNKDQSQSMVISQKHQAFQCVDTGENGDVFSFVMRARNLSLNEAIELLAMRARLALPPLKQNTIGTEEREIILEINKAAALYYHNLLISPEGKAGQDYFQNERELTSKTIKHFGLGYAGDRASGLYDHLRAKGYSNKQIELSGLEFPLYKGRICDKFRSRVMCPIISISGEVVGFSGRVLGAGKPKYINSPETLAYDKKLNLYGLNFAQKAAAEKGLILCEGNLDVISMHQAGFRNTVAPLGTALTKEQVSLISEYTDRVHLMFDSDDAGIHATERAISMLRAEGIQSDVVHLEPYKDPDEFLKTEGAEALQKRLSTAESSYHFEMRVKMSQYDLSTQSGIQDAINSVSDMLINIPSTEKQHYIDAMEDLKKEAEFNSVSQEKCKAIDSQSGFHIAQPSEQEESDREFHITAEYLQNIYEFNQEL